MNDDAPSTHAYSFQQLSVQYRSSLLTKNIYIVFLRCDAVCSSLEAEERESEQLQVLFTTLNFVIDI